ncbi:hypothetical protein C5167_031369, partial [Papaver somniferum]
QSQVSFCLLHSSIQKSDSLIHSSNHYRYHLRQITSNRPVRSVGSKLRKYQSGVKLCNTCFVLAIGCVNGDDESDFVKILKMFDIFNNYSSSF